MSELKPCPFCGGEAEPFNPFENTEGTWCVLCSDCAAATGFEQTEAEAIAAWNTRAERTCKVEGDYWHDHGGDGSDTYEFILSCGHSVEWLDDDEKPRYCPQCGARIEVDA